MQREVGQRPTCREVCGVRWVRGEGTHRFGFGQSTGPPTSGNELATARDRTGGLHPVVAIVAPEHAICAWANGGMADDMRRSRMATGNDHLPTTRKFTYNLLLHMQQKVVRELLCNIRVY